MTEIVEPTLRSSIDSPEHELQRFARLAWGQFADAIVELAAALRTRITILAAKRIAQKRKILRPRVHDVRLVRVQFQPVGVIARSLPDRLGRIEFTYVTDWSFVSCCSPPLPHGKRSYHFRLQAGNDRLGGTFTLLIKRLHRRTGPPS